ncbi:MAG: pdxJ, partial [Bacteriovoracaceae bacterium]|nr:pdxJ [Bacteriovoracaceae bacterium]
ISKLNEAARRAAELGLEVKAGHGLTLENVALLFKMPALSEVNIGHSIVSRSVIVGLEKAVKEMKKALKKPR